MKKRKNKTRFFEKKDNMKNEDILEIELKKLDKKNTYGYGDFVILDILDDELVLCQKYLDLNLIPKSSNNAYTTSIETISFLKGLEDLIQEYSSAYAIVFISEDELIYTLTLKCNYLFEALTALNDIEERIQKIANNYRNEYWEKYKMDNLFKKRPSEINWLPIEIVKY